MAQISDEVGSNRAVVLEVKDGDLNHNPPKSPPKNNEDPGLIVTAFLMQKVMAELAGTYLLIFVGCATVVVNLDKDNVVTLPGIAIAWGLLVMVLVYSLGHISGAHFNPAVTIAFAICNRFPRNQVPAYISVQIIGSTLASGTLRLVFSGEHDHFAGTVPEGSDVQSLVLEFIITFFLMFVVASVATDDRAPRELVGLVIGATVSVNVFFAGLVSGASMNPARSLGPAIVWNNYKGLWIYMVGPTAGAIGGVWLYNFFRPTAKSWCIFRGCTQLVEPEPEPGRDCQNDTKCENL